MALLQRRVLSWDYWEMYDAKGLAGDAAERLTRPPQTFSSAEVFIHSIILSGRHLQNPYRFTPQQWPSCPTSWRRRPVGAATMPSSKDAAWLTSVAQLSLTNAMSDLAAGVHDGIPAAAAGRARGAARPL